jgi:hypothetical protein
LIRADRKELSRRLWGVGGFAMMFEGAGIDPDQDFETFLRAWTKERIWSMDDFLDLHGQA